MALFLVNVRKQGTLRGEQEHELINTKGAYLKSGTIALMNAIRALGRIPKELTQATDEARRVECRIAQQLRKKRAYLSPEDKQELATIRERQIGALEELEQGPDPLAAHTEETATRLEQDL